VTRPGRASVVAIGGGHGLSVTLRAVAPWADRVMGVVSTADDGGSTGRLREVWDVPAVGDVRRCLAAFADPEGVWNRVVQRRFDAGDLAGHSVGNLLLLALTEELGSLQAACDELARTLGIDITRARVVPVTDDAVVLHGRTLDGAVVEGQVAVAETADLAEVWVDPRGTAASPLALEAIRSADLVVLGPGSLYTSVLAAAVVGDLRHALATTHARIVYVANMRADQTEAKGYDVCAHVAALTRHDVHPDKVLVDPAGLPIGDVAATTAVVPAGLADARGLLHDPAKLGPVLQGLLP
jgi:uncharacterized cofD-like protein